MARPPKDTRSTDYDGLSEQRHWERQEYQTGMTLVLEDGQSFEGHTLNVSPGGIFLSLPSPVEQLALHQTVQLRISPHEGSPHFSCTIARIINDGIGLELLPDETSFGAYISHDILLSLIGRINNTFAQSLDLKTTIELSVGEIKKHLQAEASSVFLLSDDQSQVVCSACSGPVDITGLTVSVNEGIVGRTVREQTPQTVHNVDDDPFFSKAVDDKTGFTTASILCAPMVIQGKSLGALEVINKRGSGFFTKSDEVALSALATATAFAIHNSQQASHLIEKEAAIRAKEMNYNLISSLRHKLNTPLNSVLGFAQLLETEEAVMSSSIGSDAVRQIVMAGHNLTSMVDAILIFTELESGKIKANVTPFAPHDTYSVSLTNLKNAIHDRDISIVPPQQNVLDLPMIDVDGTWFKHILDNVLRFTACASNDHGEIKLSIETQADRLRFSAFLNQDCPELKNAAPPFTPDETCEMVQLEGACTGLELAISYKLTTLMNGDIGVSHDHDNSVEIWFEFPLTKEA